MTTNDSITAAQIEQLRTEAAEAGDLEQVRLCDLARRSLARCAGLGATPDSIDERRALARCVRAINYAESMAGQV